MKTYVYNDLTGFRKLQGESASKAWASIMTDDNLLIALDPIAYEKSELREWLLSNNFSTIKPTEFLGLYEVH